MRRSFEVKLRLTISWLVIALAVAVTIALFFLPLVAMAQPGPGSGISRGDALRQRQFRTFGNVTLYVATTGSDSNACVDVGAPCLTINGAIAKLPKILQNNVTINVAAGTYAGFTVSNFIFTAASATPPTFIVEGEMQTFTPATGSSTGTVTGGNVNADGLGEFNDSAQSWTPDELVGRFVRMTSGPASGQARTVFANTATQLRVAHQWLTVPNTGDSYIIETPSVFFTSSAIWTGNTGAASFSLSRVDSSVGTGSALLGVCRGGEGATVSARSSRLRSTSGSSAFSLSNCTYSGSGTTGYAAPVAIAGSTGIGFLITRGVQTAAGSGLVAIGESAWTGSSGLISTGSQPLSMVGSWMGYYARALGSSGTGALFRINFVDGTPASGGTSGVALVAWCGSLSQTGFDFGGAAAIGEPTSTVVSARDCGTGITVTGPLDIRASLVCANTTNCLTVTKGARVNVTNLKKAGVTTDYTVDGVTYSETDFASFSPTRIVGANLSVLER